MNAGQRETVLKIFSISKPAITSLVVAVALSSLQSTTLLPPYGAQHTEAAIPLGGGPMLVS